MIKYVVYFSIVSLLAYAISLRINPGRMDWWAYPRLHSPDKTEPALFEKRDGGKALSMFRANTKRQGFFEGHSPDPKSAQLKKIEMSRKGERFENQNFAIHSASKSSLILDKGGIFWALDNGWSVYMDFSGRLVWEYANLASSFGFHGTGVSDENSIYVGDYAGVLTKLDKKTGKILWVVDLGDAHGASPVLDDSGFLYANVELGTPDGYVMKIDASTGETLWRSEFLNEQSHSSPALCGNQKSVFLGDNSGGVRSLDRETGRPLWRLALGKPVKSTPTCTDNTLIFSCWDQFIYGVELNSGKVKWKKKLGSSNQSSFAMTRDQKWAFINTRKGLCRIRPDTGEELTCTNEAYGRLESKASPIVVHDRVSKRALVWTPCLSGKICSFDAETFRKLNQWDLPTRVSGELKYFDNKIWFVGDSTPEIYYLQ